MESARENSRKPLEGATQGQAETGTIEQFAGNAHIPFEGDLQAVHLSDPPGASFQPRVHNSSAGADCRQENLRSLEEQSPRLRSTLRSRRNGTLQFGAHDNTVGQDLVDSLVSTDPLQSLSQDGDQIASA